MSSSTSVSKIIGSIYWIGGLYLFTGAGALVLCVIRIFVRTDLGTVQDRAIFAFVYMPASVLIAFLIYLVVKEYQLNGILHTMAASGERITDPDLVQQTMFLLRCTRILHVLLCRARGTKIDDLISSVMP